MSYNRRRYRRNKEDKSTDSLSTQFRDLDIQPKILLKAKNEQNVKDPEPITVLTTSADSTNVFPTTPISQRTKATTKPAAASQQVTPTATNTMLSMECSTPNANYSVNSINSTNSGISTTLGSGAENCSQTIASSERSSRPATVISSMGSINSSAKKLLMKNNSDFMVVGVLGTQGVGKSTILNILGNERSDYDYFRKIFVEQDSIFPTKLKCNKSSARSRTESTHMFITSERLILLDTPPIMANAYKKSMTSNELDDLGQIITLLSVCHLVVVIMDDYFNLNFLKLLRFAELMKPSGEGKQFNDDYYPHIMFVKNRAKRLDFTHDQRLAYETSLRALFKESHLCIYKPGEMGGGGVIEGKTRKSRPPDPASRPINLFLLPDIQSAEATTFHPAINDLIAEFRSRVFRSPRNAMFVEPTDVNEEMWFDWLTKITETNEHFFFKTYEDIQRKHLTALTIAGSNNSKDLDVWK